jgi:5-methylcytosine-specific restriction endonuclease McrA
MSLPFKFYQKKPAKTDRQKLINKLDTSFSEFIRLRDSDKNGVCRCITCGDFKHWQDIDCGHFVTRDNLATRWEEQNCNAQCAHCNRFKGGKQFEHGLAIDKKYKEPGLASKLVIKGQSVCNWQDFELDAMHQYYKAEVKQLKAAKGMI